MIAISELWSQSDVAINRGLHQQSGRSDFLKHYSYQNLAKRLRRQTAETASPKKRHALIRGSIKMKQMAGAKI